MRREIPDALHALCHIPKLTGCEVCTRTKRQRAPCRQRKYVAQGFSSWLEPNKLLDLPTADHFEITFSDQYCKITVRVGRRFGRPLVLQGRWMSELL